MARTVLFGMFRSLEILARAPMGFLISHHLMGLLLLRNRFLTGLLDVVARSEDAFRSSSEIIANAVGNFFAKVNN